MWQAGPRRIILRSAAGGLVFDDFAMLAVASADGTPLGVVSLGGDIPVGAAAGIGTFLVSAGVSP
jgi:hypothetical protein